MIPKVILITGASAGFGLASAEHLGQLGHRVYGTSRRAEFPGDGAGRLFPVMIPMDVCDEDSVQHAVDFILAEEGRIDVVVNNAGVGLAGAVEDTTVAEAGGIFDTNLFGVLRVCRAVLPVMRQRGTGLVVNVSSLAGLVTVPFQGFYSASKFALESMSDALRMELAPLGVKVVLIEPGDFKTGFTAGRVFAESSGDGSAYESRCRGAVAVMEKDEQNGGDPAQLAVLLGRIVAKSSPRPRYTVGSRSQTMAVGLRRILPTSLMDRILRMVYKA